MSNLILSKAFQAINLTSSQKFVLVSLADQASDTGICWPSMSHISSRTCLSKASVKRCIRDLSDIGILKIQHRKTKGLNKTSIYKIEINSIEINKQDHIQPQIDDEVIQITDNGGWGHGEPTQGHSEPRGGVMVNPGWGHSEPLTIKEPSLRTQNKEKGAKAPIACPPDVDNEVWQDWLALRKAKKAPVTNTVLKSAIKEAKKANLSLQTFLEIWCARGSQGLQADWLKPNERGDNRTEHQKRTDATTRALYGLDDFDDLRIIDGGDYATQRLG